MPKQPAVYILANDRNGTLYIGVTSDLMARLYQHRAKEIEGFTSRYEVSRLVWFEMHETMESAILREKQLKNWRRIWKIELIEADNPLWRDLAEDLGFDPLASPTPSSSS
ncbi:GIY-YIG nuclease family protein [Sphingomonas oryzagri]|uniref:GIY-YIG nuclease family protein n=1 Tax=Sphingomonas oryzagri TaxID=3042314 RepID=A0ABT6N669_9SPHN|nr:GIY-YIG nuclease family protein [Sphingomonas oryzagri]MDH7640614.1 GIY-YIG nuclease family protein [Sphingomonas oryzagri]